MSQDIALLQQLPFRAGVNQLDEHYIDVGMMPALNYPTCRPATCCTLTCGEGNPLTLGRQQDPQ